MKHGNLKGLVGESWIWPLGKAFDYFKDTIVPELEENDNDIYPSQHNVFRAFKEVPFDCVRVIILGQDPYHNPGSATGLAFDNPKTQKPSPSLRNILKEIQDDLSEASLADTNVSSYLEHLPSQGVLLLNTALTVEKGKPGSHLQLWRPFTYELIFQCNARMSNVVWVLWGDKAQKYRKLITNPTHKIVVGAHPSPFSYKKFKGGKYFSEINNSLTTTIKW